MQVRPSIKLNFDSGASPWSSSKELEYWQRLCHRKFSKLYFEKCQPIPLESVEHLLVTLLNQLHSASFWDNFESVNTCAKVGHKIIPIQNSWYNFHRKKRHNTQDFHMRTLYIDLPVLLEITLTCPTQHFHSTKVPDVDCTKDNSIEVLAWSWFPR